MDTIIDKTSISNYYYGQNILNNNIICERVGMHMVLSLSD